MKSAFLNGMAVLLLCTSLTAQNTNQPTGRGCGTPPPGEAWDTWFNNKVKEIEQQRANGKSSVTSYVIPVIVHVIHGGQSIGTNPNITQAQINSQIPVLNADYSGTGLNSGSLPSVFAGLKANTGVSFCMAQLDPNGNCLAEPGIERINYHTITNTNPTAAQSANAFISYMDATIKPATIWDPSRYLNIWVTDVSNAAQLLGYATFPGGTGLSGLSGFGSSTTDGVWVWSRSFGQGGVCYAPYDKGRTATHEIGHYLGLRHTWGDGTCATDYCNDTPPSQTSNFGCPTHPYKVGVCSGNTTGEMFQNFMDYSDDACLGLFTNDQNTRIQAAMTNDSYRKFLTASAATLCNIPAAAPVSLFALSTPTNCLDSLTYATNMSTGAPCPSYAWSILPSTGVTFSPSATSPNPQLSFLNPGFYTLTLVTTNSVGTNSYSDYLDIYDCNNITGVNGRQLSAGSIMLVPNPSNGLFSLQTKLTKAENLQVTVFNTLGQQVFSQHYSEVGNTSISINLGSAGAGIYQVVISGGNEKLIKRLIITK